MGWTCLEESERWVTFYRCVSPDGSARITIEYQQCMGETDIWLRAYAGDEGRAKLTLADPPLGAVAVSRSGHRLYVQDGARKTVYDTSAGADLPGAAWPHSPVQVLLLVDLFPSLRRRVLGKARSPFELIRRPDTQDH